MYCFSLIVSFFKKIFFGKKVQKIGRMSAHKCWFGENRGDICRLTSSFCFKKFPWIKKMKEDFETDPTLIRLAIVWVNKERAIWPPAAPRPSSKTKAPTTDRKEKLQKSRNDIDRLLSLSVWQTILVELKRELFIFNFNFYLFMIKTNVEIILTNKNLLIQCRTLK